MGTIKIKIIFIKPLNEKYYSIYVPLCISIILLCIYSCYPNNVANNFEKSIIYVEVGPNRTFA